MKLITFLVTIFFFLSTSCTNYKQLAVYHNYVDEDNKIAEQNSIFKYRAIIKEVKFYRNEEDSTLYGTCFKYNDNGIIKDYPLSSLTKEEVLYYEKEVIRFTNKTKIRIYEAFKDTVRDSRIIYVHLLNRKRLAKYWHWRFAGCMYYDKFKKYPFQASRTRYNIIYINESKSDTLITKLNFRNINESSYPYYYLMHRFKKYCLPSGLSVSLRP